MPTVSHWILEMELFCFSRFNAVKIFIYCFKFFGFKSTVWHVKTNMFVVWILVPSFSSVPRFLEESVDSRPGTRRISKMGPEVSPSTFHKVGKFVTSPEPQSHTAQEPTESSLTKVGIISATKWMNKGILNCNSEWMNTRSNEEIDGRKESLSK